MLLALFKAKYVIESFYTSEAIYRMIDPSRKFSTHTGPHFC